MTLTTEQRIARHLATNWHRLQRAEPHTSDQTIINVAHEIAVDLFGNPPKQKPKLTKHRAGMTNQEMAAHERAAGRPDVAAAWEAEL